MYTEIVFLQGEDGRQVVDQLFNVEGVVAHGITEESHAKTLDYLKQWDYGDEGEPRAQLGDGPGDVVLHGPDDYIVVAHLGLGCVGLYRN